MRGYHIQIIVKEHSLDPAIPPSFFQRLPSHKPLSTTRRNATFNPWNKDYRFGPIRLDWSDRMGISTTNAVGKEKAYSHEPEVATFVPSNTQLVTGSTNLSEGIVHVFRESTKQPDEQDTPTFTNTNADTDEIMLGVLAVPSWMTPSDFLAFVAPAAESISHLRMIRDSAPNRSIVIIKFLKREDATEFIEAYNGKPFNSMEPEICHVVHVLSVNIKMDDHVSHSISRLTSGPGSSYELPTCPVCLERMDSAVTGLITVPCSHTFHCMCLSKWGDSRCPVCRYSQTLLTSHPTSSSSTRSIPFANPSTYSLSSCSSCSSTANLWICLICGNIGCGRYGRAHAQEHYQLTTHLYSLELETQRVWDYAGDGYVHRLIQNKADGKLVELPSAASSMGTSPREGGLGPSPADALSAEKIEAIGIEYSYLLTSQLDSQRSYYEDQTAELKTQVNDLKQMVSKLSADFEKAQVDLREREQRMMQEEEARAAELIKDKTKAESRADTMGQLAKRLKKELDEERAVSEGLMKNLGKMKEKVEVGNTQSMEAQAKIRDLEDQLRDVMFYLEAKTHIESGDGIAGEALGGTIQVPSLQTTKKKSRKG
ncbi:zf-UBP-domain-containing protein [Guyanagaster necrorhizus]|uniref:Zf-UBP-domain-containing protein n=1 Tax=Guyanagaster necrorhizus TaxID=856835 RepID=A0A9P7VN46_9AGAR|nr:zf-UBP-domain-containing protein [Guyanagaster necrorhizus MCA 3950]KAG7443605.1 zf-UBP-domain-containing protein [Guyanagaster necrorhizus MCA 3950]